MNTNLDPVSDGMGSILILGVIVILLIMLLLRSRRTNADAQLEQLRNSLNQKDLDLARALERNEFMEKERLSVHDRHQQEIIQWKRDLTEGQTRFLQSEKELQSARVYLETQEKLFQQQRLEIDQVRKHFYAEFQTLANKIFDEKSQKFVDTNTQSLDQILGPLKEKIQSFENKVDKTYQFEAAERNTLKGVIEQLMQQSRHIQNEANSLTRALRGDTKKQGNWGEVILERVLERSGLRKDSEYRLQMNLKDEDGKRHIPDAIILLPEGKHLIVDSKVSLLAYESWSAADDDQEKERWAKEHVYSIQQHVRNLAGKNYATLYQLDSPDFVLLFMPMESAFSLALERQAELFSDAWEKRVVLVSPTTLLATLRTIASIWKQERQTRYALEIAKEAGALYDKFEGFIRDLEKIGFEIDQAKKAHQDAFRKLSDGPGNITRRIQNLKDLGARATKQIDSKYLD